jgi:uncharacterized glyoxalase superfamily protein PhnB
MTTALPEGLRTLTPALTIDGCAEAMEFYKRALGAVEMMRAPDPSGQKVWHAAMQVGDSRFFLNDWFPDMGSPPNRSRMWIYLTDGVDAAFKRAVDAGAKVHMPLGDMFWGDRLGTVVDRWGNEWTFAQHMRDVSPEEMRKAAEAFAKK